MQSLSELITRRTFLKGVLGLSAMAVLPIQGCGRRSTKDIWIDSQYSYDILLKWGDKIGDDISFGYNNDYTAYMPLEGSKRGLLCVNHETTNRELMYPNYTATKEQIDEEMRAQGHSVTEIYNDNGKWKFEPKSKYNRRFNALETEFKFSGPVKLPNAIGTFNNCSGGVTPWNTVLFCEENFDSYFVDHSGQHKDYGIGDRPGHDWYKYYSRFKDPNEPNKFGWVIEYDPYDPNSKPVKRTALGRFKHETATCTTTKDGRPVVYMGDDEAYQHLYKFVGKGKNLDEGTLYVAKLSGNGKMKWLPIPSEKLLNTRAAAHELKPTPMDRPEGVAISPATGKVYVSFSKNRSAGNLHGHIIEFDFADHGDDEGEWNLFLKGNRNLACPDNLTFDNQGRLYICTDGMGAVRENDGLFVCETEGATKGVFRKILDAPVGAEVTGPSFSPDYKTMFLSIQHPGTGSNFAHPSTRWPEFKDGVPPKPAVIAIKL